MINDSHGSRIQTILDQIEKYWGDVDVASIVGPRISQGYSCFTSGGGKNCRVLFGEVMPDWMHQYYWYISTSIYIFVFMIAAYLILYFIFMHIARIGVRYRDGEDDTARPAGLDDFMSVVNRHWYSLREEGKKTDRLKSALPKLYGDVQPTRVPPRGGRCTCFEVQPTPVAETTHTARIPQKLETYAEWIKAQKKRTADKEAAKKKACAGT